MKLHAFQPELLEQDEIINQFITALTNHANQLHRHLHSSILVHLYIHKSDD